MRGHQSLIGVACLVRFSLRAAGYGAATSGETVALLALPIPFVTIQAIALHLIRRRTRLPPNKRLKLTGHRSPLSTVVLLGYENGSSRRRSGLAPALTAERYS
jgi:hypothetical protein